MHIPMINDKSDHWDVWKVLFACCLRREGKQDVQWIASALLQAVLPHISKHTKCLYKVLIIIKINKIFS